MAPINQSRRHFLRSTTQILAGMSASWMILGGRQAYSANDEASIDIIFSPKKIGKNDKPGKLAGEFSTNGRNDTHTYSLPRRIYGPSQFGVTSPHMAKTGDMVFTVYRRFPYGAATCDYAITDGTAVLGTDYAEIATQPLSGTLNFADQEMHRTITIATMADGTIDKTVICTLGTTSGSFIEGEHIGTGTIMEPTNGVYYFDATLGSDANGGSKFRPKKTWVALHRALMKAGPGDAFLFKRGETFVTDKSPRPRKTLGAGKNGNPVIIGAYGDISDLAPIIDKDGGRYHIRFVNDEGSLQNVTIQDIRFTTSSPVGSRPGAAMGIGNRNTEEIIENYRLERVEVDTLRSGIIVGKSKNLSIKFCHIHGNFGVSPEKGHSQGMFVFSTDGMHLEYNMIHNNGKVGSIFDWQLYMGHTKNCKTRWNIMRDGPNLDKSRGDVNYEVRGNIFIDGGVSGGGVGGDNSSGSYSVSHNNVYAQNYKRGRRLLLMIGEGSGSRGYGPGEMMDGFKVYSNILHNEGDWEHGGILHMMDNSSKKVEIFNNLLISTTLRSCIQLPHDDYIGISVKNNIMMHQSVGAASDTLVALSSDALAKVDFSNNIYFNNGSANIYLIHNSEKYTTLAALQAAHPTVEIGSIEANPLIADIDGYDYTLQSTSPAIGFGHSASIDFYGGTYSTDAGPIAFGSVTSDRFYIDGDKLKILYPLSEGKESIDVISTDGAGLSLEKQFAVNVSDAT